MKYQRKKARSEKESKIEKREVGLLVREEKFKKKVIVKIEKIAVEEKRKKEEEANQERIRLEKEKQMRIRKEEEAKRQ